MLAPASDYDAASADAEHDAPVAIEAVYHREFGRLMHIVEAAELLNLVDTPKRLVILDAAGKEMVKAMPEQRKALWRAQLLKLGLFRQVFECLQRAPDHRLDRDIVLETIVLHMPEERHGKVFQTFVRWARFGNLFAYDEATESITLQ